MSEPTPGAGPGRQWRGDVLGAAAAGLIAFAVYVRTLAPGLTFDVDTAMFQFVGRVLGVGHNPGYPLFVFLTHPVSLVPAGTLAYRINLFSAGCGALAVAVTVLLARRLGCAWLVSVAAALGFAFGRIFWSQAVIAEVYTLHAALVAGVLLSIVAWRQTQRPALFFVAMALFAAGLGNHTTILAFLPGLALYVLAANRRFVLRPRTLAAVTGLLLLGVLQYGFILVRSNQPGSYVESRATTLGELAAVVSGAQFQDRLFTFDMQAVLQTRLPAFFRGFVLPELTWVGLALAAAGALWLARRRGAEALLLLSGGGAILVFALNYNVIDSAVFVLPALLILWLACAVGVDRVLVRPLGRAGWLAAAAALALPLWLVTQNFARADRSGETEAGVALDRLFEWLPSPASIVQQDFLSDRLVSYKLFGEGFGGRRQIELLTEDDEAVRRRSRAGTTVVAFSQTAERLRHQALNFSFAPLPLLEGPLTPLLRAASEGTTIALAVPAAHGRNLAASGLSLAAIGGPAALGRGGGSLAILGIRGGRAVTRTGPGDVRLASGDHAREAGAAARVPADVEVRVEGAFATIRQGGREIARTSRGGVVAMWNLAGRLLRAFVLDAANGFFAPLPAGRLSVFPLHGEWPSVVLPAGVATDLTAMAATGSVMLRVPAGDTVVLHVGGGDPFAPKVIEASGRARVASVPVVSEGRRRDGAATALPAEVAAMREVSRIEVEASAGEWVSVSLGLGGVPARAVGFVRAPAHGRVLVARVDVAHILRPVDRDTEILTMTRDEQAQLVGDGWSPVEVDDSGAYRRMTRARARLVLPLRAGENRTLRAQLRRPPGDGPTQVSLRVNGQELPALLLRDGWDAYEWRIPDDVPAGAVETDIVIDRLAGPSSPQAAPEGLALGDVRVSYPLGR